MYDPWELVTGSDLEELALWLDWNLSEAEMTFGLPVASVESRIAKYRTEPPVQLRVPFQPYIWYLPDFVSKVEGVICQHTFEGIFPDHPMSKIMQLDFKRMELCLPSYHFPTWSGPKFLRYHCEDLIGEVLRNDHLFRHFRLTKPPKTPEEVQQYYFDLTGGRRLAGYGTGAGHEYVEESRGKV